MRISLARQQIEKGQPYDGAAARHKAIAPRRALTSFWQLATSAPRRRSSQGGIATIAWPAISGDSPSRRFFTHLRAHFFHFSNDGPLGGSFVEIKMLMPDIKRLVSFPDDAVILKSIYPRSWHGLVAARSAPKTPSAVRSASPESITAFTHALL